MLPNYWWAQNIGAWRQIIGPTDVIIKALDKLIDLPYDKRIWLVRWS